MAKKQGLGSVKRFGVRYGRTVKERLAKVERVQKAAHKCPYCSYDKVKFMSVGIWNCTKCGAKFASKAYNVEKPAPVKTKQVEV
jgi:large subunit ribosomal protein L37Ae